MMMTISILVFILFLCCTVFLKGSLLGGILGMALAAGAAALAVLRRRYPQKKLATAGCVLLIAVAAGTGLLFPASGLSEESPAENPLIAQLTEAALSGDLIEAIDWRRNTLPDVKRILRKTARRSSSRRTTRYICSWPSVASWLEIRPGQRQL